MFDRIIKNLDYAILLLKNENKSDETNTIIDDIFNNSFIELKKIREKELMQGADIESEDFKLKMQEAQLVIEQLVWLTNLSENIIKTTKVLLKPQPQTETNPLKTFFGSNSPEAL